MIGRLLILLTLLASIPSQGPIGSANRASADELQADVTSLLATRCLQCHGPGDSQAGLRLDIRKGAISELESGNTAIIPGDPDNSELLRRIIDPTDPMPPEGERLSAEEIEKLQQWIAQGAEWKPHWAYRKLQQPAVPTLSDSEFSSWIKTPVDAFVLRRLESLGLKPSPPADRRTLLRRVYYDLVGFPPTPQEIKTFLSDNSTDAYERVVDQLLASPHYGERWARHWMDVVHYADSHGFEHDIYRDSWPYRDYLIKSFNEDKPYARFVQEQVAGDVLFPEDSQALVATGFLATGPWDLSALQSGNPDSVDYLISQYLDRDDILSTVMSTFVSSTVSCARCHDHKFDPISQSDYYNLQAVFAGIDKATRLYDPDPTVTQRRKELTLQKAELATKQASADVSLLDSQLQEKAELWAQSLPTWTLLEPLSYTSAEGATLTKEDDGTLFASGTRPETDTYTVTTQPKLQQITAIRLDLLADQRLPAAGPGRQDNGNLHLNEFKLSISSADDPANKKQLPFKSAHADFNQEGWGVENSIDSKPATAWGIHPQVGKSHSAVFLLQEPLLCEEGTQLIFELEQSHGRSHLIGRFQLAAIDTDDPGLLVPDTPLKSILAIPPPQRTQSQKIELAAAYLNWPLEQELGLLPEQKKLYCGTNKFTPDRGHQPARTPRPIHLLKRGNINSPDALAEPGTLSCVPDLEPKFNLADPNHEGQRRAALATWLANPKNVLTWRSITNRIWHYHIGRGIVATPSDFGQMGQQPTHPELLNWLAINLQQNGGSLKWLHRLITTSSTYRQSSQHRDDFANIDGDNRYLWRMNRRPLDAESIRDSILIHSGKLDTTMGGPPAKQFLDAKVFGLRAEADYASYDVDNPDYFRRSIYRYVYRTMPDPFMNAMDCPDASQLAPVRNNSITALQAAAMLNDPFLVRQCEHIATRIISSNSELPDQINAAYQLLYGRPATESELATIQQYTTKHGLANTCRLLLNTNEFLFID